MMTALDVDVSGLLHEEVAVRRAMPIGGFIGSIR